MSRIGPGIAVLNTLSGIKGVIVGLLTNLAVSFFGPLAWTLIFPVFGVVAICLALWRVGFSSDGCQPGRWRLPLAWRTILLCFGLPCVAYGIIGICNSPVGTSAFGRLLALVEQTHTDVREMHGKIDVVLDRTVQNGVDSAASRREREYRVASAVGAYKKHHDLDGLTEFLEGEMARQEKPDLSLLREVICVEVAKGNLENALKRIDASLVDYPEDGHLKSLRGCVEVFMTGEVSSQDTNSEDPVDLVYGLLTRSTLMQARGDLGNAKGLIERALAVSKSCGPTCRSFALCEAGKLFAKLSRLDESEASFLAGIREAKRADWPIVEADCKFGQAMNAARRGQLFLAASLADDAFAIFDENTVIAGRLTVMRRGKTQTVNQVTFMPTSRLASYLCSRAWIAAQVGENSDAISMYSRAGKMFLEADENILGAEAYYRAGWCSSWMGDKKKAIEYYTLSLEAGRSAGGMRKLWMPQTQIAVCQAELGNKALALEACEVARELLSGSTPLEKQVRMVDVELTYILMLFDEHDAALEVLQELLSQLRPLGDSQILATTLNNMAHCEIKVGRIENAESIAREAIGVLERLGDEEGIASVRLTLAEVLMGRDEFDSAEVEVNMAGGVLSKSKESASWAGVLRTLAQLKAQQGDRLAAEALLIEASRVFRRAGIEPLAAAAEAEIALLRKESV